MDRKYIVITGGVLSGLGKGVVSASIGKLLATRHRVITIKCDGYLNVDPGTMNPIEHGEVFVLDDGAEVDLDFGHYERFMDIDCQKDWSLTSGKIFLSLMEKERRGEFLGRTVQVIPHVTGEIRHSITRTALKENADVTLVEIGGTVGDIENLWFLEACREMRREAGAANVLFVHLGLVPALDAQGEQKTKPFQQSVNLLRERGIFPDLLVARSRERLQDKARQKLQWLCNVAEDAVYSDPDLPSVYELPLVFEDEGMTAAISRRLGLGELPPIEAWRKRINRLQKARRCVRIAICGKYTDLADSYISVQEAMIHAGARLSTQISVEWVDTTDLESPVEVQTVLEGMDGVVVPGGFGSRGTEGKINVISHCRQRGLPFLGICYGLQLAVIEFARNVCGLSEASSTEINPQTQHPVVDILPEQRQIHQLGGTMRLGAYPAHLINGSRVHQLYGQTAIRERHRHRYEVNPAWHENLESHGLVFSGMSPDRRLVEFIELPEHPFFVATQGHPELKSRLLKPAPLFVGLIQAALDQKKN